MDLAWTNNIRFTGTTARGVVMRRNRLENNASILLRAAIHDVLIENNTIRHAAKGIVGDLWQRQSGVLLRGNMFEDVATPYEPVIDKELDRFSCTEEREDGYVDLTLKFRMSEVVDTLGDVYDGQVLALRFTGNLKDEFGGTPIVGEDVVWIRGE